jgi:ribosomal protein L12E/L44/L45/RPP1/RPP2
VLRAHRVPLALPPAGTVIAAATATEATTQDRYAADEGKNEFEDENEIEEDEVVTALIMH